MPRGVVIESLPQALSLIKEMNLSGEGGSDHCEAGRSALREALPKRSCCGHLLEGAVETVRAYARRAGLRGLYPSAIIFKEFPGGMAEWFKAAVLKTAERKFRGFESLSLRQR